MNEKFVKNLYNTIVNEGSTMYLKLYENTQVTEETINYWKNALNLYHSLDNIHKEVFMDIIKQTIIDTVSSLLGILDGTSILAQDEMTLDIKINGIDTENELQDMFLEYVEELRGN